MGLTIALGLGSLALAADEEDPEKKHKHKKHEQAAGNGQPGGQALSALGPTPCAGGLAYTFPCRNVDLASFLPLSDIGGGSGNDIWGWTDPLTNRAYALMGRSSGTSFVDISDPERPAYLGNLPTHTFNSSWRDIKVYSNHAFIVSEASGHGMQVFDLTQLRNVTTARTFTETAHYAGFGNSHNVAINESTGFAYAVGTNTCTGGLHMVNIQNPKAPVFVGCFASDGYTHDTQCVLYDGPDGRYVGRELCFSSNEDTLTIVDVTNKGAPVQLSRTGYTKSGYTHQGWLTEDHRYFLLDDERDEVNLSSNTRTIIWDVSNVAAPFVSGVYVGPTRAIDHNLYIRGQLAYEANYRSGLRILDITNVAVPSLSEVGYFDVYPVDDLPAYNGAWSNYPFFDTGIVIVSGIEQGLFVLRPTIPSATQANLSVTIADAPDPLSVGQNLTYSIVVSNGGLAAATGVTLSGALSPDVSLVSAGASQGSCSGSTSVTCALGSVANGGSATVTIVVRAEQAGTVATTATVSANESDPDLANNSATATTTVAAAGTATASFVGADVTTQGTWRGVYGQDGYWLAQDAVSLPGYAQVTLSGESNWIWAASTTDPRALQKPVGSDRLAAAWYSPASFTLDIYLTDAGAHEVALYCLDWDPANRSQQLEVFDATSNALLDARAISSFSGGQYLRWRLSGHVRIRVTTLSSINAVVSGLFFDTTAGGGANVPPVVSLTSPAAGTTYTAPASIALAASASDSDGSIDSVEFYANGSLVGIDTTSPYQFTWSDVSAGGYSLTAKAVDNVGATTESSPVNITVDSSAPPGTMHVGDLDSSAQTVGKQIWTGTVTVTVHDAAHDPVAGASVSGQWSGGRTGTGTCTTNGAGQCSLGTGNINVKKTSATFTITGVTHATFAYRSTDNHDVDGGSSGTAVTVTKP